MILRRLTLIALLCIAPVGFAVAQDDAIAITDLSQAADAPPGVDARNYAVAMDIVKSFDMKTMLQNVMGGMAKAVTPAIERENPGQDDKIEKITADTMQKTVLSHAPEVEKNKAAIYAQLFTYAELTQLKQFYQSPVGRKLTQKTPEMMRRNAELDHTVIAASVQEMQKSLIQELKKNGLKIPKELGPE